MGMVSTWGLHVSFATLCKAQVMPHAAERPRRDTYCAGGIDVRRFIHVA